MIAAADAPAGGAATGQVIAMTIGLSIAFGALALLGEAHRRGRRTPLGTLGAFAERVSGLPAVVGDPARACSPSRCPAHSSATCGMPRGTSTRAATRGRSPTPPTT